MSEYSLTWHVAKNKIVIGLLKDDGHGPMYVDSIGITQEELVNFIFGKPTGKELEKDQ